MEDEEGSEEYQADDEEYDDNSSNGLEANVVLESLRKTAT
jgi:hypothetical protein